MKKKTKDRLIFGLKIITVLSLGVAAGYMQYTEEEIKLIIHSKTVNLLGI